MKWNNLPILIFLMPFLCALVMPFIGWLKKNLCYYFAVFTLGALTLRTSTGLLYVIKNGSIHYTFGGWLPPFGIEWVFDGLSGIFVFLIAIISFLVVIYSKKIVNRGIYFYTSVLLLVSSLIGMSMAADFFNLFVFLEVGSLTSYALVAMGRGRATFAAFKYLLIGTIGASFYLLGVGYIYAATGSLNMADISHRLVNNTNPVIIIFGISFIVVGLAVKMGLFPLHGWLPDAYTYAPDSASSLFAPIATKIPIYALIRIFFWVVNFEAIRNILGWLSIIAIVFGAVVAFVQVDFKRMLAYSSISQIGLIVLGISISNKHALTGVLLHIINHAFMKGALFCIAGAVFYKFNTRNIFDFTEIRGKMPFTMTAFLISAFSMIGIPPTCGFFSKWYLLLGAIEAKNFWGAGAIALSTLLTALYFFVVIEKVFFNEKKEEPINMEAPFSMGVSIGTFSIVIILLGVLNFNIVSKVILPVLAPIF